MIKETLKLEDSNGSEISIIHDYKNIAYIRIKSIDQFHPVEEKTTLFHLTKKDAIIIIKLLNDFIGSNKNQFAFKCDNKRDEVLEIWQLAQSQCMIHIGEHNGEELDFDSWYNENF